MALLTDGFGLLAAELQSCVGQTVILRGPDRDELLVTAVAIAPGQTEQKTDDGGSDARRLCRVVLVGEEIGDPGTWREIEIDGTIWHLQQPPEREGQGLVFFQAVRVASKERTGRQYRG